MRSKRAITLYLSLFALLALVVGGYLVARSEYRPATRAGRLAAIGPLDDLTPKLKRVYSPGPDFEDIPTPRSGDWLAQHEEKGQTWRQFRDSKANRPSKGRRTIYLLPLGEFTREYAPKLEDLKRYAAAFFGLPVKILPTHRLEGLTIKTRINGGTGKRQYLTGDLLGILKRKLPKDAYCLLGVTMEDLYPQDDWNYVFGQATLRNRVGVYSFARYSSSFWGENPVENEKEQVLRRSVQTLVHETAHMFGMHHCIYFSCVVNGSNHLEEADRQPLHLCPVCLRKLVDATRQDPIERYRSVEKVARELGLRGEAEWIARRLDRIAAGDR